MMRPHGQWHIHVVDSVIELKLTDTFNEEGVKLLRSDLHECIAKPTFQPSSTLIEVCSGSIAIPEAYSCIREMHAIVAAIGISKVAYFCHDQCSFTEFVFEPLWQGLDTVERRYFKDKVSAKEWLKATPRKDQISQIQA